MIIVKRVGKLIVFGAPIHATSPTQHSVEDPGKKTHAKVFPSGTQTD